MDPFLESVKNNLIQTAISFSPLGPLYAGLDLATGGRLPGGIPRLGATTEAEANQPQLGARRVKPNGDIVYYAGPNWGEQSGESYKKATGAYPKGYEPARKTTGSANLPGPWTPPAGGPPPPPTLPGATGKDSIPQTTDAIPKEMTELVKKLSDLGYIQQREDISTGEFLKRGLVTSLLTERASKEKTRRAIEEKTIDAWKEKQVAAINANAAQSAALASMIYSSMQFQGGNPVLGAYEKTIASLGQFRPK